MVWVAARSRCWPEDAAPRLGRVALGTSQPPVSLGRPGVPDRLLLISSIGIIASSSTSSSMAHIPATAEPGVSFAAGPARGAGGTDGSPAGRGVVELGIVSVVGRWGGQKLEGARNNAGPERVVVHGRR